MKYLLSIICCFVSVQAEEIVRIYHTTASSKHLESIKQNGLCSGWGSVFHPYAFVALCKKFDEKFSTFDCLDKYFENTYVVMQSRKAAGFADQMSVIYFKPEEPGVKEFANIAIEVDAEKTYVYNMEHRARAWQQNPEADALYRNSRVLLSDYLKYLKEAEKMVEVQPDLQVELDPETARPFYLEKNDPRKKLVKIDGKWVEYKGIGCSCYNAEVIIPVRCISPTKLIFLSDKICEYPVSNPVVNKNNV